MKRRKNKVAPYMQQVEPPLWFPGQVESMTRRHVVPPITRRAAVWRWLKKHIKEIKR